MPRFAGLFHGLLMVVLFMGLHGSWVCPPPKPDPLVPDVQLLDRAADR